MTLSGVGGGEMEYLPLRHKNHAVLQDPKEKSMLRKHKLSQID